MSFSAINWNREEDSFTQIFWRQFIQQFWVDTEIPMAKDKPDYAKMTADEQDVFKKVLGGLTLLDTKQSMDGMPSIAKYVDGPQRKATLQFAGTMEAIHAKSYSTIFTTLLTNHDIDEVFEWVDKNPQLQKKAEIISKYYDGIQEQDSMSLYKAMVASVFLESFLFYSGFFYPLHLAAQGRMMATSDMITLIITDESVHGVYVGLLAQELYNNFSEEDKSAAMLFVYHLLSELMENEESYTDYLYTKIGLQDEVKKFLRYNANKALMNLGLPAIYPNVQISQAVLSGLSTESKTHDFFSVKGNSYIKANVEELTNDVFDLV